MRRTRGPGRCGKSRPTADGGAPSRGRAPSAGGSGGPCRGPPVQRLKKYVLVRALYSVVTLWLLVTIIFGLVRLTGDPVAMKAEAGADAAYVAQLRQSWGLAKPLYRQYLSFIRPLFPARF